MKRIFGHILVYLEGLALSIVASLIFAAVGWIQAGNLFSFSRLAIPAIVGAIIWTLLFACGKIIWALVALMTVLTSCLFGIGFFIALALISYGGLALARFLLPVGWVSFTEDGFLLFVMGGVFALIDLLVNPTFRKQIAAMTTPPAKPEKDD